MRHDLKLGLVFSSFRAAGATPMINVNVVSFKFQ
jgi:hypothetical protein